MREFVRRALLGTLLIIPVFQQILFCETIGSDIAVSLEPFTVIPPQSLTSIPPNPTPNNIASFPYMKSGFALQDATTTCSFNSVFPVSGLVALSGGSLYLTNDLVFENDTVLSLTGNIFASDHKIKLCESIDSIGSGTTPIVLDSAHISLANDLSINCTTYFSGVGSIAGNGSRIVFNPGGSFVFESGATVTLRDLIFDGINGSNIIMNDDSVNLALNNVIWNQTGYYTFTAGSIKFINDVDFLGSFTFAYQSKQTSTIDTNSQWKISDGMTLKIGRQGAPLAGVEPLAFVDSTGTLALDNCTAVITPSGMLLTKGSISIDRNVEFDINSSNTNFGLQTGDGTPANDVLVDMQPGSLLTFGGGAFVRNVTNPNGFVSRSKETKIQRNAGTFYLKKSIVLSDISIEALPGSNVTFDPGAFLTYNDAVLETSVTELEVTGTSFNAVTTLLGSNGDLFINKGVNPLLTRVTGAGSVIHGPGDIGGAITLTDSTASVNFGIDGLLLGSVVLNGGTFVLTRNTRLGSQTHITGPGTIVLSQFALDLGTAEFEYLQSAYVSGNGASITMYANKSLSTTLTFSGNVIFNGNGNTLTINPTGAFVIEKGSSLKLKNIIINGVKNHNIACLDNAGVLSLENVVWNQSGDFTFTNGSIQFINDVDFVGQETFFYQSSKTSTIHSNSQLRLLNGTTLSIGRQGTPFASPEPLAFTDNTSILHYSNATLVVTASGWLVTKGTVQVERNVVVDITSTQTLYGLQVGDGTTINDPIFELFPGASLTFGPGQFVYDITSPNNIISRSDSSTIIRQAGSNFYLKQNVTLSNIGIEADPTTITTLDPGKILSYNDALVVAATAETQLTATRYDPISNLLAGNGDFFINKGALPTITYISGVGNSIAGSGDITGPIVFLDPFGQLTFGIDGVLFAEVLLNGGSITLSSKTTLGKDGMFVGPGMLVMSDYSLDLGTKENESLESLYLDGDGANITLNANKSLSTTLTFSGNIIVDGGGNILNINPTGNIVVERGSTLKLKNIIINGVTANNISCLDDAGVLILENMTWNQSGDFTFSQGSLQFADFVQMTGEHDFVYQTDQTSTINSNSTWAITEGLTLSIGRQGIPFQSPEPLAFIDNTATWLFDNATLNITSSGMLMTNGTLELNRNIQSSVNATSTLNAFQLGDGNPAHDVVIDLQPGVQLNFGSGPYVIDIVNQNNFVSRSTASELVRNSGNNFYFKQSLNLYNIALAALPGSEATFDPGKLLTFNNVLIEEPLLEFSITGTRYDAISNILPGNGSIFISRGQVPTITYITGTGNEIAGSGDITGPIVFLDPFGQLILGLDGTLFAPLYFNGGTVVQLRNLALGTSSQLVGPGTLTMGPYSLYLGTIEMEYLESMYLDGAQASIYMRANMSLSNTITFSGQCVFEGGSNILTLNPTGAIVVEQGSTLKLKNITINGVAQNNIRCLGDSSLVILENVKWIQDDNYSFTKGALHFNRSVEMLGGFNFAYQTGQTSTILEHTQLLLDAGFTFSYDPQVVASQTLLSFAGNSATLFMDGATLYATATGIELHTGHIVIRGNSNMTSETVFVATPGSPFGDDIVIEGGIAFGDNSDPLNDFSCTILAGAKLELTAGRFIYQNINRDSWNAQYRDSIFMLDNDTKLTLSQDLLMNNGIVILNDGVILQRTTESDLLGSVQVLGTVVYGTLLG